MGSRASLARMPVFLLIGIILSSTPLASNAFPWLQSSAATVPVNPPTLNTAAINASMRQVLTWAESRVLPNGTATLQGTSNNLWATSLVGRTLTYIQLEIGNLTTRTIIQNMTKAGHILLQNPSFISYGIWSPANLNTQFQVHLDAQKFLSRTYGLTLDPTARSDLINVTQNMHLNLPLRSDYFDTVAWTLSNAVWFAYYSGSSLPAASDFTTAVQDLNTNYNLSGATSAAADPLIDFAKLLRFLKPITYTDSYFRLQGNSLSQSYQTLETGLANQLVKRQGSDGNIVTVNPFRSFLNITNPGNALTTVNTVSGIVDSYLVIHNTNVLSPETPVNLATCQIISSPSLFQNLSWLYIAIPLALILAVAIGYERRHRAKYHGLVEK